MRTTTLQNFLSDKFRKPVKTVEARLSALQAAGLVAKGKPGRYGGVDLAESDVTSAALSLILDFEYGADIAAEVLRVRSLPATGGFTNLSLDAAPGDKKANTRAAFELASPMSILAVHQFGDALDSVIRDFRSGTYAAWTSYGGFLAFEIVDNGTHAHISLSRKPSSSATFIYGEWDPGEHFITRNVRISHEFFRDIAQELGPLAVPA